MQQLPRWQGILSSGGHCYTGTGKGTFPSSPPLAQHNVWVCTLLGSHTRKKESSEPFSMNSVMIMTGELLVTTPSRWMTLG